MLELKLRIAESVGHAPVRTPFNVAVEKSNVATSSAPAGVKMAGALYDILRQTTDGDLGVNPVIADDHVDNQFSITGPVRGISLEGVAPILSRDLVRARQQPQIIGDAESGRIVAVVHRVEPPGVSAIEQRVGRAKIEALTFGADFPQVINEDAGEIPRPGSGSHTGIRREVDDWRITKIHQLVAIVVSIHLDRDA